MFGSRASSWNLRDQHMFETLENLIAFRDAHGRSEKVMLWAHNSHLGDARATEMGRSGERHPPRGCPQFRTLWRSKVASRADKAVASEVQAVYFDVQVVSSSVQAVSSRVHVPSRRVQASSSHVRGISRGDKSVVPSGNAIALNVQALFRRVQALFVADHVTSRHVQVLVFNMQ
jgi:hypothetical protein